VRIHHTQRFPIGTRVSKYFNSYSDPFEGTVDQHSELTDFYHITYDDGDSEEMTEDDVETHFLKKPKRPSPVSPVVRESDMVNVDDVEFNILRKVLFIAVSTLNNQRVDVQLDALSSTKMKVGSRNGRNTSTVPRERDFFGNLVPKKRKLGTASNWRARRSTVVLDQVTKRVSDNAQEVGFLKTQKVVEEDRPTKISFIEDPHVLMFEKEVEVSKLLVFRPTGSKAPERPPIVRRSGPLRSILRVKLLPPVVPEAAHLEEEAARSAPPTVQSTSRPALEPIVVDAVRPSLDGEKESDGTAQLSSESPHVGNSKLSKVVSPTEREKKKHHQVVASPPPVIPLSEQPPLDFTEGSEVSTIDNGGDKQEYKPETPKEDTPVKAPASTASPVVSEDESSGEEGEVTPENTDAAKPEDDIPSSCSADPKDATVAIESPVGLQQQSATSA
ncbi:hypothetical protein BBJ29_009912, partial [Phytophthora kernoviae]